MSERFEYLSDSLKSACIAFSIENYTICNIKEYPKSTRVYLGYEYSEEYDGGIYRSGEVEFQFNLYSIGDNGAMLSVSVDYTNEPLNNENVVKDIQEYCDYITNEIVNSKCDGKSSGYNYESISIDDTDIKIHNLILENEEITLSSVANLFLDIEKHLNIVKKLAKQELSIFAAKEIWSQHKCARV